MRVLTLLCVGTVIGLGAGPAVAQQLAQAAPAAAARAGVAAAVRGEVKLAAVPGIREVGKDAASGDPIFLGDRITTGGEGRLQIMLLDETVFTIGPNAALVIDQFVFDPQTNAGKVSASVLKGTFRFVTGKVAKREPSDMEVKLPVGSIGVRGTSVAGQVEDNRATVVLLGPGPETSSNERVGRILVTGAGPAGAATVEIVRPGFGTEIAGPNIPPSPAVRIDPGRIAAITAPLAGTARPAPPSAPQGQAQGQPGQATPGQPQPTAPQPGQPAAAPQSPAPQGQVAQAPGPAGGAIILASAPVNPAGGLAGIRTIAALAPVGQQAVKVTIAAGESPPPLGAETTFEQLRSINSGTATFAPQTRPLTGAGTGSYTINYTYNFSTRSATGSVTINEATGFTTGNGTSGTFNLLASPFNTGSGPAKLMESGTVGGAGGTITVDYAFLNSSGTVFKALAHKVTYVDGVTGAGQGVTTR